MPARYARAINPPMLWATRSIWGTWAPESYLIVFRKAPKSASRASMVLPGSTAQLSKRYTTGTPSDTRYEARLPNVVERVEMGHALLRVKPFIHPFTSTTGGRVELGGTVTCGFTTTARVVCRSSPVSLVAESVTVYSPGFVRGGAASRI